MADRLCRSDALPNAASAAVTRQKVFDYALNPDHPIGKEKARHTMSSPTPQFLLMGQQAEAKVFAALAGLPAPWQVFQTVEWRRLVPDGERVGEADVVVFHPQHGLVVLEVKSGAVEVRDGLWYYASGRAMTQSPFSQARRFSLCAV